MFFDRRRREPIFFAHIPKTAGTSFREAAIKAWGKSRVWLDYGDSQHTTDAVAEWVHGQPDYFKFQRQLHMSGIRMLSGHAPIRYYRRIFPASHIVTIVRNPIERIISHYQTARSHQNYRGDFLSFCAIAENQNIQTRYLEQMPLELIGYIGLTEQYDASLELFNASFETDIKKMQLNRQLDRQSDQRDETLSTEEIDFALKVNEQDMEQYKKIQNLFMQRLELFRQQKSYVHGKLQTATSTHVSGWAVEYSRLENPVQLELFINNVFQSEIVASQYQPVMKERNAGRGGYIGFKYRIGRTLKRDDRIEVRVAGSGQILNGPRHVSFNSHNYSPGKNDSEVENSIEDPSATKDQTPIVQRMRQAI